MIPSPYQDTKNTKVDEFVAEEGLGRFTKPEILAFSIFKDNEVLIKALRKVFAQIAVTPEEDSLLKRNFGGNEFLFSTFRKVFEVEGDDNLLIGGSRWSDKKYADLLLQEVKPIVLGRQDSIKYVSVAIERLREFVDGGSGEPRERIVDIAMLDDYEDTPPEVVKRRAVAFQDTMIFLEICFNQINIFANKKEETPEQREERLKKDSTE